LWKTEFTRKSGQSRNNLLNPVVPIVIYNGEKRWKEGLDEGVREGVREGAILDKQDVLLRLLSRKFGPEPEDRNIVTSCGNPEKLDAALDIILFASEKEIVLKELEGE
jgi:hypothetical protein